jgi:hypothetical protein
LHTHTVHQNSELTCTVSTRHGHVHFRKPDLGLFTYLQPIRANRTVQSKKSSHLVSLEDRYFAST